MKQEIIYPTIDLFLYDLKNGLGQDNQEIEDNCEQFCKKIFDYSDKPKFDLALQQFKKYLNDERDEIALLEPSNKKFDPPLDGRYYPMQLGDTYGLFLDYSGKLDVKGKPDDEPQNLADKPFEKLKQQILKDFLFNQTATIGQTWLVWGKIAEPKTNTELEKIAHLEKVAQECYKQIVDTYNWERDFIGKSHLSGGTMFELWYHPPNIDFTAVKDIEDPKDRKIKAGKIWQKFVSQSCHVLIWLFPENVTPESMRLEVQNTCQDWLRLFHYRHKIVWAYYQSRYQKTLLKQAFVKVESSIKTSQSLSAEVETGKLNLTNLEKQLTATLTSLSQYAIELNYLENQSRTIKVNLDNYKYRLEKIRQKTLGDLTSLERFGQEEIFAPKYLRQIETDSSNFLPGLTIWQNLANTINGIIEIEQTKSDRNLNKTIAIASTGLATSGVTATILSTQIADDKTKIDDHKISVEATFFWSFISGIVIALIVTIVTRFLPRS